MPTHEPTSLIAAAYGFRIEGVGVRDELAVSGAADWPLLRIERQVQPDEHVLVPCVTESSARLRVPGGWLEVDRAQTKVTVHSRDRLAGADITHPSLWPAAAVLARWRGLETLHAGAFLAPDGSGAWVIMAESGGGKSSLLASLASTGSLVLADDLVVIDAGNCYAGPRCIDLKPDAADALSLVAATTSVRSTSRRRLSLGPCAGQVPVRGFITLAWDETIGVDELAPSACFSALLQHRRVGVLGAEYERLLELAGLPTFCLRRPRAWGALDRARRALLERLAEATR